MKKITTQFLGQLLASVVVAGGIYAIPASAKLQANWYQIPGKPIWLDVGLSWRVTGDAVASRLRLANPKVGRIEIAALDRVDAVVALQDAAKRISARYKDAKLSQSEQKLRGIVSLDNVDMEIVGRAVGVQSHTVSLIGMASKAKLEVLEQHLLRIIPSIRSQWTRPGGGDVLIPQTTLVLRQPEAGWQSKREGNVLRMASAINQSRLEIRAEFRLGEKDPKRTMARWSRSMLPPDVSWESVQKKTMGGLDSLHRKGKVVVRGNTWTAYIATIALNDGALVLVATEQLFGGTSRIAELEAVLDSLRQQKGH